MVGDKKINMLLSLFLYSIVSAYDSGIVDFCACFRQNSLKHGDRKRLVKPNLEHVAVEAEDVEEAVAVHLLRVQPVYHEHGRAAVNSSPVLAVHTVVEVSRLIKNIYLIN